MRKTKFAMRKQLVCKYRPTTSLAILLRKQRVQKRDSTLQLHNVWVCQRTPSWSMTLRMPRCSQTLTATPKLGLTKCAKMATPTWCSTPVPAGWMKTTFERKVLSTPLNLGFRISGLLNTLLQNCLKTMRKACVTMGKLARGSSLLKRNCFQENTSLTTVWTIPVALQRTQNLQRIQQKAA